MFFQISLLICARAKAFESADEISTPVTVSFNETLAGFGSPGGSANDSIADFEAAYDQGKKAGTPMGFALHVAINDVDTFLADNMHAGVCTGAVWADSVTGNHKTAVGTGGEIDIFDGGVRPTHELGMEYTLPFVGADGENYVLRGVKHMPGKKCLGILSQITTLYCHVYKVGTDPAPHAPALSYVRKGISKINVTAVIKLVASLRVGGGDTPLDRIEGFLKFAAFLLGDVGHNCLNTTATAVNVEYFWSSDGTNGVLLGMVRRPDHLELRTVTYMPSAAPTMGSTTVGDGTSPQIVVAKEVLPLSAYKNGTGWVAMGNLNMSTQGCVGIAANNTRVDVMFTGMDERNNTFLPSDFEPGGIFDEVSDFVPVVTSKYGAVGGEVGTVGKKLLLRAGTPLVRTSYSVPVGMEILRWGMISASQFEGSDLQIEMLATPLYFFETLGYLTPQYIKLDGIEYKQDTLADIIDSCNVTAAGELDADQTSRIFSASIKIKTSVLSKITIQLDCIAPVGAFALVEKEGSTYIHTTVMADCTAMVTKEFQKPQQFVSKGRNLMEAKE